MRKCKITVFDYHDATHNASARQYDKNNPSKVIEYNVEAYCVGGDTGIFAYWIDGDRMFYANGDDGHFWLVGVVNKHWLKEMIEALQAVKDQDDND
jgi:hypothetical protein